MINVLDEGTGQLQGQSDPSSARAMRDSLPGLPVGACVAPVVTPVSVSDLLLFQL